MQSPEDIRLSDYVDGERPTDRDVLRFARDLISYAWDHGWLEESWWVTTDTAKRRAGVCRPSQNEIGISSVYIAHASIADIDDTVRHELAHACDYTERGRSDHSAAWRRWCKRLGMVDPQRCSERPDEMPAGKYEAYCPACDAVVGHRWRLSAQMRRSAVHNSCHTTVEWRTVA